MADELAWEFDEWELRAHEVGWLWCWAWVFERCKPVRGLSRDRQLPLGEPLPLALPLGQLPRNAQQRPTSAPSSEGSARPLVAPHAHPWLVFQQDKGKRPVQEHGTDSEEEEEQLHGGGSGGPSGSGGGEGSSGAGECASDAAGDPPQSPRHSEPGDMTCAICLGSIPLENLALVKVGASRAAPASVRPALRLPCPAVEESFVFTLSCTALPCTYSPLLLDCAAQRAPAGPTPGPVFLCSSPLSAAPAPHPPPAGLRPHVLRHLHPALGAAPRGAVVPAVQAAL